MYGTRWCKNLDFQKCIIMSGFCKLGHIWCNCQLAIEVIYPNLTQLCLCTRSLPVKHAVSCVTWKIHSLILWSMHLIVWMLLLLLCGGYYIAPVCYLFNIIQVPTIDDCVCYYKIEKKRMTCVSCTHFMVNMWCCQAKK